MPVKISSIGKSPKKMKRFRILINENNEPKKYDFGLLGGQTYIDHADKDKRDAYIKRHMANQIENKLIRNLIPSPALFSMKLLWGQSSDLNINIRNLQREFDKKY